MLQPPSVSMHRPGAGRRGEHRLPLAPATGCCGKVHTAAFGWAYAERWGAFTMTSFSIDMDDPKETWEALYREIEATAHPAAAPAPGGEVRAAGAGEDLVGWLWLMHACWADDLS